MSITTRVATEHDAADLARLNALFNAVQAPPEVYAARLRDPARVETAVLAFDGGRAIGFAALRISPSLFYSSPHAEMTELFVEESHRRKGAARALIAHVEALAQAAGAHTLLIQTGDDNLAAQALYRACGYENHDISMLKHLP